MGSKGPEAGPASANLQHHVSLLIHVPQVSLPTALVLSEELSDPARDVLKTHFQLGSDFRHAASQPFPQQAVVLFLEVMIGIVDEIQLSKDQQRLLQTASHPLIQRAPTLE